MAVAVLTLLLAFTAIIYGWRAGGKAERAGAYVLLAMVCIGRIGRMFVPHIYDAVDPVALTADLVGFVAFSALGIGSRRVWPLWAASLQLLSTGAHFVRALDIPVRPPVYWWMKNGPTWVVMLLLIAGTWMYRRRASRPKPNSSPS